MGRVVDEKEIVYVNVIVDDKIDKQELSVVQRGTIKIHIRRENTIRHIYEQVENKILSTKLQVFFRFDGQRLRIDVECVRLRQIVLKTVKFC